MKNQKQNKKSIIVKICVSITLFIACLVLILFSALKGGKTAKADSEITSDSYIYNSLYEYTFTTQNASEFKTIDLDLSLYTDYILYVRFNGYKGVGSSSYEPLIRFGTTLSSTSFTYISNKFKINTNDRINVSFYSFFTLKDFNLATFPYLNIQRSSSTNGRIDSFEFGYITLNLIEPIYDSIGNVIINNVLYYSQQNYNDSYNQGYQFAIDSIEQNQSTFNVLTTNYINGISAYDNKGNRLNSSQLGLDYNENGELELNSQYWQYQTDFEYVDININLKNSYYFMSTLSTYANTLVSIENLVNGEITDSIIMTPSYGGNLNWTTQNLQTLGNNITFRLTRSGVIYNLYAYVINDLESNVFQAYQNGYKAGTDSQLKTIRELQAQIESEFNLFSVVSSFLNIELWSLNIGGNRVSFSLGLMLSFALGLTAIFIFVKIFK